MYMCVCACVCVRVCVCVCVCVCVYNIYSVYIHIHTYIIKIITQFLFFPATFLNTIFSLKAHFIHLNMKT